MDGADEGCGRIRMQMTWRRYTPQPGQAAWRVTKRRQRWRLNKFCNIIRTDRNVINHELINAVASQQDCVNATQLNCVWIFRVASSTMNFTRWRTKSIFLIHLCLPARVCVMSTSLSHSLCVCVWHETSKPIYCPSPTHPPVHAKFALRVHIDNNQSPFGGILCPHVNGCVCVCLSKRNDKARYNLQSVGKVFLIRHAGANTIATSQLPATGKFAHCTTRYARPTRTGWFVNSGIGLACRRRRR